MGRHTRKPVEAVETWEKATSVRKLLSITAAKKMDVKHLDIKAAFHMQK